MQPLRLILRARCRAFLRTLHAYGFELFALGPVIVGGALWVGNRHLVLMRETLEHTWPADSGPLGAPGGASLGLALGLLALQLPGTFTELYGRRAPGRFLDPLPVRPLTRFHATLAAELARSLAPALVVAVALGTLSGSLLPPPALALERAVGLIAAAALIGLLRLAWVQAATHWRPPDPPRRIALGLGLAGAVGLGLWAPAPALRLLLLPLWAPAAHLDGVVSRALQIPPASGGLWAGPLATSVTLLVLYLAARLGYLAGYRSDLEHADRLIGPSKSRRGPRLALRGLALRPSRALAVGITRDVQLVLRRFSPAVPLCASCSLLTLAAVASVVFDADLPSLWRQRLALIGSTLAVLACVSLVPFLLKYQLPRFWIEKSTGVEPFDVWKAKLWTSGLLALVPFAAGVAILALAPLPWEAKAVTVLQLTATAGIVTSIVGLVVFEIAAQPLLGLVFGSLVSLALAALFAFYPQAWWLWLVAYLYVAHQIAGRATRRVRLMELEA